MLIIGELINATRKTIREAVIKKDQDFLQDIASKQDEAGAHYIDVNVATGAGKQEKEVEDMQWAVNIIKEVSNKPLAIDTSSPAVLAAGLQVHGPGAMINSISAEEGRLEDFMKLAQEHDCLAIALPIGDKGVPGTVEERLQVSRIILEAAEKADFPADRLYFDPLSMPLGVDDQNGLLTLETIRAMKKDLGVKTALGLTNASHGLPRRELLNRTFLTLALHEGLDAALMNPLEKGVMSSLLAARVCLGQDSYCGGYLRAFRSGRLVT